MKAIRLYRLWIILFSLILSISAQAKDGVADDLLPKIGSRVRVMAPRLGEGWHFGMFNQLRVPRPCYRVIIFAASNVIKEFLTLDEITKMQVSTIYNNGFVGNYDPTITSYSNEEWVDVSVETWKARDDGCK